MSSFSYTMVDRDGKIKKGTMEALSQELVMSSIIAQGYTPVSIRAQNKWDKDIDFNFKSAVKPRDLSMFCRKFVSILSAGVSIINALDMLQEQTENKTLSKAILAVKTSVEKGETLAHAMGSQVGIFTKLLVQMVEAGEASGNLEIAFERMAIHFEKDAKIKTQVKKAMIYPSIIGLVSVLVIIVMMVVVIPSFMSMFNDMSIEIPKLTKVVLGTSKFIQKWWYIIALVVFALAMALYIFKKSDKGKELFGGIALKIPVLGKLNIKSTSARFTRTLSTLLAAGIPMIEAVDITARTFDNLIVKNILLDAKEEIARGVPISIPLKKSGIFPPMVCHMAKIGEETGNIDNMLVKVADYYEEEVEAATQVFMAIMEPGIIIILSIIVGILVMSIMQPMMSMYGGIEVY